MLLCFRHEEVPLQIQYRRNTTSEYSKDLSCLTAFSRKQCFDLCQNPEMRQDGFEKYNPLLDGFVVGQIIDNGMVILEESDIQRKCEVVQKVSKVVTTPDAENNNFGLETIERSSFVMGDEIGRGNFGVVYTGKWVGTTVAIKQIKFNRRRGHVDESIQKELSIHARVRHPNIVQLMAVCLDVSFVFILSELVNGPNLEDFLFDSKGIDQLETSDMINISLQCSQAVAYLHNLHPMIIHQDIKPANVLLSLSCRPPLAKLCDFGLGRIKTMHTVASAIACVNGTPFYMAPECLLGGKSGTASSDVWSLGCTLIELWTKSELWSFPEETDLFAAVSRSLKEKIAPHASLLLNSFEDGRMKYSKVLCECLDFNPDDRPSAFDLANIFAD